MVVRVAGRMPSKNTKHNPSIGGKGTWAPGLEGSTGAVGPREEHAPIGDPEAKPPALSLYAPDVAVASFRVPIDAGNDAGTRSRIRSPRKSCPVQAGFGRVFQY